MKGVSISVKKKFASLALLSIDLIIVLLLFVFALIIFSMLAYGVLNLKNDEFDFEVFERLSAIQSPSLTNFMQATTFLGNHQFLIPANLVLIAYFLFIKKHKWYSIKIPVIAIGGVLLMFLLKTIFNRPRPLIPLLEPVKGLCFPSGHALMSVAFYGLLIFIIWENVKDRVVKWSLTVICLVIILLIGFTRIYLRLHYFSDVIAGFAAGVIWLSVSIWVVRRFEMISRRKIEPVLKEQQKVDKNG